MVAQQLGPSAYGTVLMSAYGTVLMSAYGTVLMSAYGTRASSTGTQRLRMGTRITATAPSLARTS